MELFNNGVAWIKFEGMEGDTMGFACILCSQYSILGIVCGMILMTLSPKDCNWIFGGDFHMIETRMITLRVTVEQIMMLRIVGGTTSLMLSKSVIHLLINNE